jgi:hypothetical protein
MSMLRVVFAMLFGLSFAPAVLGQLQLPQADPAFKGKIGETYKAGQSYEWVTLMSTILDADDDRLTIRCSSKT